MNWNAVGAVAELIGSAGVVLSLLYLAVQIRRDSAATRANTTQLRASGARDIMLSFANSEDLANIQAEVAARIEAIPSIVILMEKHELTRTEAIRINFLWLAMIRTAEANYRMPMTDGEMEQYMNQTMTFFARGWERVVAGS